MDKRAENRGRPKSAQAMRYVSIRIPEADVDAWKTNGRHWRKAMVDFLADCLPQNAEKPPATKNKTGRPGRPVAKVKLVSVTLNMTEELADRFMSAPGWPWNIRKDIHRGALIIRDPGIASFAW